MDTKKDPCERLLDLFNYTHLPEPLQAISRPFHELASQMLTVCPHNQELTIGLRTLWRAKNECVMAELMKGK